jgi:hypothetical protein
VARSDDAPTEAASPLATAVQRLSNLLALVVVKGEKDETEKVRVLSAAGFPVGEIAALLNKTPNAVSVALYQSRKSPGARRRPKRGEN